MQEKLINEVVVRKSNRYPNYGCSFDGQVFQWYFEKPMSILIDTKDYPRFRASHNGKPSNVMVHLIVADCWVENPDPQFKINVNHKDGDKKNFSASNLEWVTRSENQLHAIKNNLKAKGENLYNSELSESEVHLICQKLQQGALIKDLASEFDVSKDIIRKIKDGSTYFHIRCMYPIDHKYISDFSESTVRWVCENIVKGLGDRQIKEISNNSLLKIIDIKRIRNKIRYRHISDEYF